MTDIIRCAGDLPLGDLLACRVKAFAVEATTAFVSIVVLSAALMGLVLLIGWADQREKRERAG